ncbi:MAG: hypothetical protein IJU37_12395 [Desulfovibrio sp.]|nr:hypothetical protein [Desulfovibrio sp.]
MQDDPAGILDSLSTFCSSSNPPLLHVAVRSSCLREDAEEASAAGAYLSLLNIDASDPAALTAAIDKVIASYGETDPQDQVLIQAMIPHVAVTGVIMTRVLADGTPYYVINYDDESGRTDTITGGTGTSKTVFVYRGVREQDFDSSRLRAFVALAKRLEELCASDALDIEFCMDAEHVVHLLQVRPIAASKQWSGSGEGLDAVLDNISHFIHQRFDAMPGLFGQRTLWGVMPDWNPAEMIGVLPHPLASSLYRNLITSRVWSAARMRMGYREMPPLELMHLLLGRPYIDVRASFNSFLPEGLDAVTSEALVSAWLDRLETKPELHDKIEFDIAQTVLDFCFDRHLDERYPGLLSTVRREGFRKSLRILTQKCLDLGPSASLALALDAVTELHNRQAGRPLVSAAHPLPVTAVPELLAECRKYGTLPFSILARHAFIAESLLRTAAERGVLEVKRIGQFKRSVETISGRMSREFREVCIGRRDSASFMQKYGHLRPGSYDILSPRYVDRKGLFNASSGFALPCAERATFALTAEERDSLRSLLNESGLTIPPEALMAYAARAIAGREFAKFVFSRNISDVLEIVAHWAESLGFSREDASFVDIQAVGNWLVTAHIQDTRDWFAQHIACNRATCARGSQLKLGYLIRSLRDVYVVPQHRAAPNFVGTHAVRCQLVRLYADSDCTTDLTDKIICIENADPGFDWVFTRGIAGLVTKFGGTNSHMAIRCAEYGLPAAIGVGEKLFNSLSQASAVALDPLAAVIKPEAL